MRRHGGAEENSENEQYHIQPFGMLSAQPTSQASDLELGDGTIRKRAPEYGPRSAITPSPLTIVRLVAAAAAVEPRSGHCYRTGGEGEVSRSAVP